MSWFHGRLSMRARSTSSVGDLDNCGVLFCAASLLSSGDAAGASFSEGSWSGAGAKLSAVRKKSRWTLGFAHARA
jgi:hypothetical protein